jgi:D-alanyl-D-alanine dipeptidase
MHSLPQYCWLTLFWVLSLTKIQAQGSDTIALTVQKKEAYLQAVTASPFNRVVNMNLIIPTLQMDLRYASKNNFTGKRMYPSNLSTCYLREEAAKALKAVSDSLLKRGYYLKIFDAYRPYAVTVRFWNLIRDGRYVANPALGGVHNRGIAVDLTLVDKTTGKEIDMGTGFDNFSTAAYHSSTVHKSTVLENRKILKETMEYFGFRSLETEWWHYSLPNPKRYEVLNLSFKGLKAITAID